MSQVASIDREFDRKAVLHVNMREDTMLALLADPFRSTSNTMPSASNCAFDARETVGKDVNVDVRTVAHVAGERAANQSRPECSQQRMIRKCFDPHFGEALCPAASFVDAGKRLDFVANLAIGRQIRTGQ